jgi:hypothetical protein
MSNKPMTCLGYLVVTVLLAGAGLAQSAGSGARPDFTGVWTRYAGQAPGGPRGELPLRDDARAKIAAYQALVSPAGETPGGYCLGTGMPGSMLGSGGYPMEIIQRPDQITIIYEAHNEIRRIYFGNRVIPAADRFPERNGYSTGRWEGDTLVVETTHLKEQVDQRYAHSEEATIVERYSIAEENGRKVLTAEMTMTDPGFYTEPVSETKRWSIVPNGFLMTYECNEPIWIERLEGLREAGSPR